MPYILKHLIKRYSDRRKKIPKSQGEKIYLNGINKVTMSNKQKNKPLSDTGFFIRQEQKKC